MLLDLATVFFLVAGTLLLWLNIRRRPHDVFLTKLGDDRSNDRKYKSRDKASFSSPCARRVPGSGISLDPNSTRKNSFRVRDGSDCDFGPEVTSKTIHRPASVRQSVHRPLR